MKNTTFRKKALLSSVAMLLVAIVALGSATFAWFTANPNADASGLVMKTSTSAGLVAITSTEKRYYENAELDEVWSHNAILNCKEDTLEANGAAVDLQPASYPGSGDTFYTVAAASDNDEDADTNAKVESAAQNAVYSEQIYLKVTGGNAANANLTKVSMTANDNGLSIKNAIRVLITNKDNTAILGEFGLDNVGNPVLLKASDKYSDEGVVGEARTITTQGTALTTSVGKVGTDGSDFVNIYVYLDGEDSECYSRNVDLTTLITNVKVEFALA